MPLGNEPESTVKGGARAPEGGHEQTAEASGRSEVLTVYEVAHYLKLPVSTIYLLTKRGDLPGHKVGRQWRFFKPLLDARLSVPAPARTGETAAPR
jgi:excisionase family DNA binding protein